MNKKIFDSPQFFADLDWVRRQRGMTWKALAAQAGVSASTLTRVGQGKRPDVDGLCALIYWADLDLSRYLRPVETTEDQT